MMYSHKHRVGFIHIPKAAGTSIRRALLSMFPGEYDWYQAPMDHMHVQGWIVRDVVLGKHAFSRIRWFAVTRHPVHTIWASYMRTRQIASRPKRRGFSKQYCEYLDRFLTYKSFDEYATDAWLNPSRHLRPGGLWQTYCCDQDGTPLPVRVLRFDNLASDWERLLEEWRLPRGELGRENSSGATFERGLVSDQTYAQILDYCHADCERFGYR